MARSFAVATCLLLAAPLLHAFPAIPASDPVTASVVRANPNRAYAPSCLSYPLPVAVRGAAQNSQKVLADVDGNASGANGNPGYTESLNLTVWRVACTGGTAAVLVRYDRATAFEGRVPAADIPGAYGTQAGRSNVPLRQSLEPNAYWSDTTGYSILGDAVLVLDVLPVGSFDFNAAFTLSLDTVIGGSTNRTNIQVPAYNAAAHPDSGLALEINGYLTGSWYDPARSGEGILFEVGERADGSRFVFFSWFTYDQDGDPYWLVGTTNVAVGARTITVPALYFDDGGFAGAFDPAGLENKPWGSVTFTFPTCNSLTLQFASTHADNDTPVGSGTRTWSRLSGVNGFLCQ